MCAWLTSASHVRQLSRACLHQVGAQSGQAVEGSPKRCTAGQTVLAKDREGAELLCVYVCVCPEPGALTPSLRTLDLGFLRVNGPITSHTRSSDELSFTSVSSFPDNSFSET